MYKANSTQSAMKLAKTLSEQPDNANTDFYIFRIKCHVCDNKPAANRLGQFYIVSDPKNSPFIDSFGFTQSFAEQENVYRNGQILY